ncbi:MAG TPA: response regulator transcription factor [Chitinophagaceae bacterium]|nr:response regulator transcription factor [Chitinophagaceae bacterium]
MNNKHSIRIAIADDHIMVRDCICRMISATPGFEVCIKAGDGIELIEQLTAMETLPGICILDVQMPGMNGYEAMKHIRKNWPELKVLVLSMLEDEFAIARMLALGANGYLGKSCSMNDLLDALLAIDAKGYHHSELIPANTPFLNGRINASIPNIDEEEMSFLKYCPTDMTIKEIAGRMAINADTAQGYMGSLFQKLNLRTRHGLAIFAVKAGLVSMREVNTYPGS